MQEHFNYVHIYDTNHSFREDNVVILFILYFVVILVH